MSIVTNIFNIMNMDRTLCPRSHLRLSLGFVMIIMAAVIGTDGQNVGEVSFEIGVEATVTCSFDVSPGQIVVAVYWAASAEEPASFPTDAIIIQYELSSGNVTVPNKEKYGDRVSMSTDSYSLVINPVELDLDTPWYACQANVNGAAQFDAKKAARIARGAMSSENTCTASSGSSQFVCTKDDTLTCTVDDFTPNTNFELDWNAEALEIGEQGDLTISADPTQEGYFTASRTLTIMNTDATEPISVFCTALGKAYMYAESGKLVGDPVIITVEVDAEEYTTGEKWGIGIGVVCGCGLCAAGAVGYKKYKDKE